MINDSYLSFQTTRCSDITKKFPSVPLCILLFISIVFVTLIPFFSLSLSYTWFVLGVMSHIYITERKDTYITVKRDATVNESNSGRCWESED